MKKIMSTLLCVLLLAGCAATYDGPTETVEVLGEYEVRHYSPFENGPQYIDRSVYAYDIYGNRVREMAYRDGELERETRNKYDERGNVTARTVIDHSGWLPLVVQRDKMTYDDQNRVLTNSWHDGWGRQTGWSAYVYDDEEHTIHWSNGAGSQVTTYLDEEGLALREVSSDPDGSGYDTIFEYDDRRNRTGWVSTRNGQSFGSYEAQYDDQNRQISGVSYDENGTVIAAITYSYDDEQNCKTIGKADGGRRVEYYREDGQVYLIEDYDPEGEISMVQQYIFRDILVPANGEE